MSLTLLPRPPCILQIGDVIAVAVAEDVFVVLLDVVVVLLDNVEVDDAPGQLMSEKLPRPFGLALSSDTLVAEIS